MTAKIDEPITTDNWGFPPFNRTSFQQVQSLFPTARICRGPGPITEFSTAQNDLGDLHDITYNGPDGDSRSVQQMLQDTYTDSFLVVKKGAIVYEQYFNGMAADSLHLLNSVTKSFTGMLACIMAEQGRLQVDDRVTKYLPELLDSAFSETTVRHLLDMTAAVKYGENYDDARADFWKETAVVGWRPALVNAHTASTLLQYAQSLSDIEQADGEKYHYRTVLTNVLGMVIESAGGKPLQALLHSELWSKLGPEQDAAIVVDRVGFPYVGAGGNACTRDLARFGQMMVQGGFFNGEQIVPTAWIDDTRYATAHATAIFADSDYGAMLPGGHYRNKLWVQDSARGVLLAIGIHGQTIHMNLSTGVVIVKLSSHPAPADPNIFQDTFMAMSVLSEAV